MGLAPPIHLVGKVPQALKKLFLAIFPYVCNEQTCEIDIDFSFQFMKGYTYSQKWDCYTRQAYLGGPTHAWGSLSISIYL